MSLSDLTMLEEANMRRNDSALAAFRVDKGSLAVYKEIATASGMTFSAWLREVLDKAAWDALKAQKRNQSSAVGRPTSNVR